VSTLTLNNFGVQSAPPGPSERRELAIFSFVVVAVNILIMIALVALQINTVSNNWYVFSTMFVPGLLACFLLRRHGRLRSVGWGLGRATTWFWAIALPLGVIGSAQLISLALGFSHAGAHKSTMGHILTAFVFYTAVSIPFALGEELGWRGWAQSAFIRQFGLAGGLLLLGLLWGLWHTPLYYVSDGLFSSLVQTPVDNILVVVPMAWLYTRSRSIWVPTFTHAFADILISFSTSLFPRSNETAIWITLELLQLLISVILYLDLRRRYRKNELFMN
jgi:membrane protease YdiL (CAAX protease family)